MYYAIAESITAEEAAVAGAAIGMSIGALLAVSIVWFILQVIADWKIFTKAGQPGWKSIIPIYNYYVEYDICWNAPLGLVYAIAMYVANYMTSGTTVTNGQLILALVLSIVMLVLHIIESGKLARAFGKGAGFAVFLFLLGPIARIVLGFGSARYVGKR